MRIFISWSKPTSAALARALRAWLPEVIQTLEPWMSQEDVSKGQRWSSEIATALDSTSQGLICVTKSNMHEPWLNFEAGALAKSLTDARVRPLLLGVQPHEVKGPLAQFQATVVSDRTDMFRLATSLNEATQSPLESARLERAFDRAWVDFLDGLDAVRAVEDDTASNDEPPRDPTELLGEVLTRVRNIERAVGDSPVAAEPSRGSSNSTHWKTGDQVFHDSFGVGTVLATAGSADALEVTVAFPNTVGTKRLLARYAPLRPVDEPPF